MIFNSSTSYFHKIFISLFLRIIYRWNWPYTSQTFLRTALTGAWNFSFNLPIQMKWNEPGLNYFHLLSSLLGQVKNFSLCPPKLNYLKREKKKKRVWRWSAIIWCPEKFGVNYFYPPAQHRNWHQFQNYIKINNK